MKLQEGHPVDSNLRPVKVGGETTALELSKDDVRVNNIHVNGTTKTNLIESGDLTIDDSGSISLDVTSISSSTGLLLKNAGTLIGDVTTHHSATYLTLYENGGASVNAYITISSGVHGASKIATVDSAGTNADLTLEGDTISGIRKQLLRMLWCLDKEIVDEIESNVAEQSMESRVLSLEMENAEIRDRLTELGDVLEETKKLRSL